MSLIVLTLPGAPSDLLFQSATTYRKISKGSDHWLASELCLPCEVLEPIAEAIDCSLVLLAWPHQILLLMNPELGKESGGVRTIAKTPKLYRLWARTRRKSVAQWEATLQKPYDAARKASSALVVASTRSLFDEVSVLNGLKVWGSFFDLHIFSTRSS